MRTLEGIRYLINLDSAEIQQNFAATSKGRLMKNVCCGLSSRAIAKQEGVYYSSVDKSIAAAKKNFIF